MSIPYVYRMVDFSGLDLATINFSVVDGIYNKIVEAIGDWGVAVFYNWFFGEIPIAPQHCQVTLEDGYLLINGIIKVTEGDEIGIPGIVPTPIVPTLVDLSVTENGTYLPSDYDADGFGAVTVNVESPVVAKRAIRIWTQSTGGYDASINVQVGTFDGTFSPITSPVNIPYSSASQYANYGIVDIQYSNLLWHVRAATIVSYNDNVYTTNQMVREWRYDASIDMLVIEV